MASSTSSMTETNLSPKTRASSDPLQEGSEEAEDFETANPTRDTLADGLVGLLRPSLETLDRGVANTRAAQGELRERIEALETRLNAVEEELRSSIDLEPYIAKLSSSKKRILVVNSLLRGTQERLHKVHHGCLKATTKRRSLLESASPPSASDEGSAAGNSSSSFAKLQARPQ